MGQRRYGHDPRKLFFLATILLALASFDSAAQPTAPPIRRIDHIMIRADDPAKVYAFFTDTPSTSRRVALDEPTRINFEHYLKSGSGPRLCEAAFRVRERCALWSSSCRSARVRLAIDIISMFS